MNIRQVTALLEQWAPRAYQESYDNAGLICGDPNRPCTGVMVCLDSLESVLDEALATGCNLVVAHHPIVFSGLKKITGATYIERVVIKAIKNDVAIYAIHTNLDNVYGGVNFKMAEVLGLSQCRVLKPKTEQLCKLVVYGLEADVQKIKAGLFNAGAGHIGNYDQCSFTHAGTGTFRPNDQAQPFLGQSGAQEQVDEHRCEVLAPRYLVHHLVEVAKSLSSYEELAYDVLPLLNAHPYMGSGLLGVLPEAMDFADFLQRVKERFGAGVLRYTTPVGKTVKTIALCGGSGSFCLPYAIEQKADVLLTADFKYHQFFDADGKLAIVDIGHYESEQFTIQLIADFLKEKITTFAVRLTSVNTNPVNYF
ncbi:MAG TPA: Nif3-like dinuclear metal center hexameric protein [Luteibaculaceae bacterium]|nr:Nif3-like dinuclear metal center hexameric protein [Luteibaculaceae bacterium]